MKRLLLTALLLLPVSAFAQPAMPAMKTHATSADVQALVAAAKAEHKDQPMISKHILTLAPYNANMEYRPATSPAAVHEKEAELMVVIDGAGTLVTGGKLKDEKRTNAANLSGSSIDGGNSKHFAKGDFAFVPEGTPHQVIPDSGSALVLMTFHVPRPVPGPAANAAGAQPDKTFASAQEVAAALATARAAPPKPIVGELLLNLAPYRVQLEYNPLKGDAAVHGVQAELMYVIDGSGDFDMGGTLADEKPGRGGNLSGSAVVGGTTYHLAKGDFIIVPEGTPHQVTKMAPGGLTLMTLHPPRPVPAN